MKIAVPVDENRESVCASFGRAPYFCIYDTTDFSRIFTPNAAAEARGGAGIKAAQLVVDSGAQALITMRCGENAAEVLQAAEIGIYKAGGASASANIALFNAGKLEKLTHFHAGFQGIQ